MKCEKCGTELIEEDPNGEYEPELGAMKRIIEKPQPKRWWSIFYW